MTVEPRDGSHVLILIGAPGKQAVSETVISAAVAEMTRVGAAPQGVRRLERGTACELPFRGPKPAEIGACVRTRLAPCELDLAVLPEGRRRKQLLVADMDSTILSVECLDELAVFAGLKDRIAAITERAMRGELRFEDALAERVSLLAGLETAALERTWAERVRFTPGADVLVATMAAHGARTVLVSGGFTWFAERAAHALGFARHYANRLEIADGALTGRVLPPVLGREAKRHILLGERRDCGCATEDTLAVGDGANDLDMLAAAGLGVAFRAKPAVAAAAPVSIVHGDLTALLFLQGYRRSQFVVPETNRPRGRSGSG